MLLRLPPSDRNIVSRKEVGVEDLFPDRTDVTLLTSSNERLQHRQVTHYKLRSRRACREQRMLEFSR
ncbi:hypothetical protein CEXT_582211 [Caerostris extrusa]|uniref:Uncharacterized protein n=1 Tax=Caerostris extrusa TaxID=172846 RepID=A0AAV4MDA5_CAEEX|nr:hypothetical protein CEXT_582211 [Caerostris extrusa]